MKTIAVSADHRGKAALDHLTLLLQQSGCKVLEMGDGHQLKICDYPDQAYAVAGAVADGTAQFGILVCGSGIGMCIAANKVKGVRAALVHDEIGAEMSRRHNDANVLCLAGDLLGLKIMERIVQVWLTTAFEGGRHARRVRKIRAIEEGQNPADVVDEEQAAAS